MNTQIHPLTADRWKDLEQLFGVHGAYSGCWCMFWRLSRAEFARQTSLERKAGLHALVERNDAPGLVAYVDGVPAGWCSIGLRESYPSLERSRTLKRIDDRPVWSIVCFFMDKAFRRQGLMSKLLTGAVEYARSRDARIVEGYPIDLQAPRLDGQALNGCRGYMGIAAAYRAAGFVEVGRASATQLIMRFEIL